MQPINHQTVKGSGKKSSSTNGSRVDLMAWRWPYECNIRIICTPLKLKANSSIYASILSHIFQNEDATLAVVGFCARYQLHATISCVFLSN